MKLNKKLTFSLAVVFPLLFAVGNTNAQTKIVEAFPNLSFSSPVDIQNASDGSNRIFVVEQRGIIKVFPDDSTINASQIFLDITDRVSSGGEMGLLGLAFHPLFKSNGYFYVDYTTSNPRKTVISRFQVSPVNANSANASSEKIILEVSQPYSNHNGGQISFGPDGYLYASFGDGGSGGDPDGNGQNLNSLLGSIIRIDVNNSSGNLNYSIPSDNPFVGLPDHRGEIYAYGLRNVWRFSFDNFNGNLWAADVGQGLWEEIDLIKKGKNYGWNIMEGFHCYNASSCDTNGLTKPVWEYGHNPQGGYSITGGYVYYGTNASELTGKYIYGDYVSGNIWSLDITNGIVNNRLIQNTSYNISTFGKDEKNELFFADYSQGKIYKFTGDKVNSTGGINQPTFKLKQNYPNPFNPNTTIEFTLEKDQNAKVEIFNTLGQLVDVLISGTIKKGSHSFQWRPVNTAGSIYYYKLTTKIHSVIKKMVYLK